MSQTQREETWRQTLEVAASLPANTSRTPGRDPEALPRPGELYLSRRTAEFPVEWLVLHTSGNRRFQVVPVDDYPLVGSRDLQLPQTTTGGIAVARCGVETWTDASALAPDLRTAVLERAEIEAVQQKLSAVEQGAVEPSLLEEVAEGDYEYQQWIEGTLRPAALAVRKPKKLSTDPRFVKLRRHAWPVFAAAAMLALVVGLGRQVQLLSSQLEVTQGLVAELREEGSERVAEIETERQLRQKAESENSRLGKLLSSAEASLADKSNQLTSARNHVAQAVGRKIFVNVKELVFGEEQRFSRGGTRSLPLKLVKSEADLVNIEVEVATAEPYLSYRLRIVPRHLGQELVIDQLQKDGTWLRFNSPAAVLEIGEYDLVIEGLGFGEPEELEERYSLTVEN